MEENEEELESLLMKVKTGEWKSWPRIQHSKTKMMVSVPITSWQVDGEKIKTVRDLIFWESQIMTDKWLQPWN